MQSLRLLGVALLELLSLLLVTLLHLLPTGFAGLPLLGLLVLPFLAGLKVLAVPGLLGCEPILLLLILLVNLRIARIGAIHTLGSRQLVGVNGRIGAGVALAAGRIVFSASGVSATAGVIFWAHVIA